MLTREKVERELKYAKDPEKQLEIIAQLNDVTVEELEVMPEHVHMLISFKPKYTPTNIVKALKGGSARLFLKKHPEIKHDKFWGGHIWSRSYYMSTLGNMSKEVVAKYIQNQYSK